MSWWGVKSFRGLVWVWHQNLSVALLSQAQELPFKMFDLLKLIQLIALYGDIPSSSSWAKGKSGQINQSINQSRFWLNDDCCPASSGPEKYSNIPLSAWPHPPPCEQKGGQFFYDMGHLTLFRWPLYRSLKVERPIGPWKFPPVILIIFWDAFFNLCKSNHKAKNW